MSSATGDALVMALHTIYTMAGFGKHEFVDSIMTRTTLETMGVIRVVASHDSFVKDRLVADAATIGTV